MAPKKRYTLYSILDSFFSANFGDRGKIEYDPIIILDTSAVIDIEKFFVRNKRDTAVSCFDKIAQVVGNATFIVPKCVYAEIGEHHKHHKVGKRKEISNETYGFITSCYQETGNQDALINPLVTIADDLRYLIRSLYFENIDEKKLNRDPISCADWDLVDQAIYLARISEMYLGKTLDQRVSLEDSPKNVDLDKVPNPFKIAVLSSDKHIYFPLELLLESPEGIKYNSLLKPINLRNYKLDEGN
jgi:hypothetical protein